MKTPVAFLIFNRPDHTARVFDEIARAKPRKLLVVADGPRTDAEVERCAAARAIIERVDWECEVLTNYSDVNMGCKRRVSSGLDWVFDQCEEAIILEDDCLPQPTFFRYCAELLEKYRDDERIMAISGDNFQFGQKSTPYSYYFSRCNHIWGWASWRRAWRHYDVEITLWPELRESAFLRDIVADEAVIRYWAEQFDNVREGRVDTWDYQWVLAVWANSGLTILPCVNLISNIGFGEDATHTTDKETIYASLPAMEMSFPLQHPPHMVRHLEADLFTQRQMFSRQAVQERLEESPGLYQRLWRKLLWLLPDPVRKISSRVFH